MKESHSLWDACCTLPYNSISQQSVSYAQALLTCYLIPAMKGWGRGRLTTIPGVLSPAFFLEARERILETRLAWKAKMRLRWSRTSERKERKLYHRDDNYLSWPLTISDKNLFLHKEWSISSQLMITRRNVSEHICSINIHIISDYDSITLNIGVIRYNDQQLKKEKQQLFKLWKNIHF